MYMCVWMILCENLSHMFLSSRKLLSIRIAAQGRVQQVLRCYGLARRACVALFSAGMPGETCITSWRVSWANVSYEFWKTQCGKHIFTCWRSSFRNVLCLHFQILEKSGWRTFRMRAWRILKPSARTRYLGWTVIYMYYLRTFNHEKHRYWIQSTIKKNFTSINIPESMNLYFRNRQLWS